MRGLVLALLLAFVACALAQCSDSKIYDGAVLWSWYGWDTTVVQQDNSHQYGGKPSICWQASDYTGMYFHTASGTLSSTDYAYLTFWVNGYSGGQNQRVELYNNDVVAGSYKLITDYTGGTVPTQWTEVKVPISNFAYSGAFNGIVFQSNSGTATQQNVLCYANVTLVCGSGTATTSPPANFVGSGNSPNGPYSVSGNKILDKDGNTHIFRGFARPSLEWSATGEFMSSSDCGLQAGYGANVMRVSLNQNFWLSGSSQYNDGYKSLIQTVVTQAKAVGMSVILDLHWSNQGNLNNAAAQQVMADAYSITFWQEVAAAYKDDPEVLFELYNEPHDVPCNVWLSGGTGSWGFDVAGMQELYDAVRGAGANNLVIVGGLDYAYDLSCVKTNPLVGTNIVYNTHPYFNFYPKGTPDLWNTYFGFLFSTSPVMATEFGNFDCSTSAYVTWLNYTQAYGVHWTAWAWYVKDCGFPSLVTNWNGALTAPGQLVANALFANRPGATGAGTGTGTGTNTAAGAGTNSAAGAGSATGAGAGSGTSSTSATSVAVASITFVAIVLLSLVFSY